jgi:hypothetical protein
MEEKGKRYNKNKELNRDKTGQELFHEALSGQLPMAGLEPAPSDLE